MKLQNVCCFLVGDIYIFPSFTVILAAIWKEVVVEIKNVIKRFLGWKKRVWVWMLERQESCGVRWAWLRQILGSIHVVFAGRELVTTQSYAWSVQWVHIRCGGISGNRRVLLISTAEGAWQVRMASSSQFCWKRLWLSPMWSWNVFPSSAIWATHLVREEVRRKQQEPELRQSSRRCLISYNLTARGESYRIKGKILKTCIQSVLTYETETWLMKKGRTVVVTGGIWPHRPYSNQISID